MKERKGKREINLLSAHTVSIEDLENPKIETLGNTKFFLQNRINPPQNAPFVQ